MKRVVRIFLVGVLIAVGLATSLIFSGWFNVSTQWQDPSWLRWVLVSTREASIETRAENITAPRLTDATRIKNGFRSYREMCMVCHTPPGGSDSPIAQGLNPSPTDLTLVQDHAMTASELFWVIKNGIRMTGMPAWGPTHGDTELWDIVAFLKALPNIDAAAYRQLDKTTPAGHGHGGGDGGHKQHSVRDNLDSDMNTRSHGHVDSLPTTSPSGHDSHGTHAH